MANKYDTNQQAEEDYVDDGLELVVEEHRSDCQYESIIEKATIVKRDMVIYILVRVCRCGMYTNKEHVMKQRVISFYNFADGVELHVDNRCHYMAIRMPNGHIQLQQQCYCPRDLYDQLGIE